MRLLGLKTFRHGIHPPESKSETCGSPIRQFPFAPVLIVSPGRVAAFEEEPAYVNMGMFQLRHGVFLTCYVEQGLREEFLHARESD